MFKILELAGIVVAILATDYIKIKTLGSYDFPEKSSEDDNDSREDTSIVVEDR